MNKYTFLNILENEVIIGSDDENNAVCFDKIEIPMIQRDYAQGRKSETEIRNRFLNAIFTTLCDKNQESLEMDFIYGSFWESDDKKANSFIPLDGQQRLTTLFLLYWYIGLNELENEKWNQVRSLISKFTYETRISSRRFCENLVSADTKKDIFEISQTSKQVKNPLLSKRIKNLSWFYYSYEKDPTIKAMLNMLDAIDERYKKVKPPLWSELKKLQFYVLPLNGFGLSEELYIKMNARGKQLTDFENLKADLVNWMKDEKNKYFDIFQSEMKNDDRKTPYYLAISQKIDNEWSRYFWNITRAFDINAKDKKGELLHPEGKLVDPLFIKVLYRYFTNKFILHSKIDATKIDKEDTFETLIKEGSYQNFEVFQEILDVENIIPDFEIFFDSISNNWETIKEAIQPNWKEQRKYFYEDGITQSDRVVFLAISLFLEKNNYDSEKFSQWMRIVWNIVENTDIADIRSMIGVMKLIQELAEYSSKIYEFLADDNNAIESSSSKTAIIEERQKAYFIAQKDSNWENVFIETERHPFFKGSISFLITDKMSIKEFQLRSDAAFNVFDKNGVNEEFRKEGHLFLRALISRFTDKSIIGQNLTDLDENEHYLKKLLANNDTVRTAIREWFNLDITDLKPKLTEETEKESQITGWQYNDESEKLRINRAHEALYKSPELQNWMHEKRAIRFSWSNGHLYISRPRSWYDWIQLESIRNELISKLENYGFTSNVKIKSSIPFYIGRNIELLGEVHGVSLKIIFDYLATVRVEKMTITAEWETITEYNYITEDKKLLDSLTIEKLEELITQ